jgi:hypothetical protein
MKSIHIDLVTESATVRKNMHTNVTFDADTTFEALIKFQKEAKKIFRSALKAAEAGNYYEYTLTVLTYKDGTMELLEGNSWTADSREDKIGRDDNEKEYIYLLPDGRNENQSWDMCMYADVTSSLAEAHI